MDAVECHVLLERSRGTRIPDDPTEIRLFSKCRNEQLRLPEFLRHYRALGVQRFFFADNASTDGSLEYLESQPDVHVFFTTGSFREARGGTTWLNALLAQFGVGRWCVTVDIDELLYYPGSETASLQALTRHFDGAGVEAMRCHLLDMYPAGAISDSAYKPGESLVNAAPWFDRGPYSRLPHGECPGVLIYGGVRERIFFPEAREGGWRRHLHVGLYHRAIYKIPGLRSLKALDSRRPVFPPCLTKVPLVRWDAQSQYLNVNHFVSPKRVAAESGVLLHFKFLQDFHARAEREAARGEYYDGAIEFRRYAARLRVDPRVTFRYEGSARFETSDQLVELGLMDDTPAWRQARTSQPVRRQARS